MCCCAPDWSCVPESQKMRIWFGGHEYPKQKRSASQSSAKFWQIAVHGRQSIQKLWKTLAHSITQHSSQKAKLNHRVDSAMFMMFMSSGGPSKYCTSPCSTLAFVNGIWAHKIEQRSNHDPPCSADLMLGECPQKVAVGWQTLPRRDFSRLLDLTRLWWQFVYCGVAQ